MSDKQENTGTLFLNVVSFFLNKATSVKKQTNLMDVWEYCLGTIASRFIVGKSLCENRFMVRRYQDTFNNYSGSLMKNVIRL